MKMNVEIDGRTYQVDIEDIHERPVIAKVDGERYEVWPEIEPTTPSGGASAAQPVISVPEPTQSAPSFERVTQENKSNAVTSPLPGVIVAIMMKPGDRVSRGQELCTLEAMKMKNAIRSVREGTIATVEVNVGDQVGHGQVLMTYAD